MVFAAQTPFSPFPPVQTQAITSRKPFPALAATSSAQSPRMLLLSFVSLAVHWYSVVSYQSLYLIKFGKIVDMIYPADRQKATLWVNGLRQGRQRCRAASRFL